MCFNSSQFKCVNFLHPPPIPPHSYLSVEDVSVVVDVVGQQVGLGAHQQHVPGGVGPQPACRQTGDGLVDVEQRDVRVLAAVGESVGRGSLAASVRVVDENLRPEDTCWFGFGTQEVAVYCFWCGPMGSGGKGMGVKHWPVGRIWSAVYEYRPSEAIMQNYCYCWLISFKAKVPQRLQIPDLLQQSICWYFGPSMRRGC